MSIQPEVLAAETDLIIGIDFDNTLISYDALMHRLASDQGLIPPSVLESKKAVHDWICTLPDGEIKWQKLQAAAYGRGIKEAELRAGVDAFLKKCGQEHVKVRIVSHKTEFANYDEGRTNLREAALGWMQGYGFFDPDGLSLSQEAVYFEPSRAEKIQRIRNLGCTHFIDDLEQTFLEDTFPVEVEKILYSPHGLHATLSGVRVARSWNEIRDYFFASNG